MPFLHEAIRYLSVHTTAPTNLEIGAARGAPGTAVTRPDGTAAATPIADMPGIHRVAGAYQVAVNLPRSESSVALRDAAEVATAITAEALGREERRDGAIYRVATTESARERVEGGQRIGFLVLFAVLALLLIEHLLANATVRT